METTPARRDEMDEHLVGDAAIAKVRALLPYFRTTMLITRTLDGRELHIRPMGLEGDPSIFGGTLWFFTDDRSCKVREIEHEPGVSLAFQDDEGSRYLHLTGTAVLASDRPKMRELFSPRQNTWFPDGLDDPHLTLIRFDATGGSFWETPGGVLQTLAAFTKAVVTGTPSKAGRAGTMDL